MTMKTTTTIFHDQAALVRTAVPGYRILRRIVALQRAGMGAVHRTGGNRPADPYAYPLAAE